MPSWIPFCAHPKASAVRVSFSVDLHSRQALPKWVETREGVEFLSRRAPSSTDSERNSVRRRFRKREGEDEFRIFKPQRRVLVVNEIAACATLYENGTTAFRAVLAQAMPKMLGSGSTKPTIEQMKELLQGMTVRSWNADREQLLEWIEALESGDRRVRRGRSLRLTGWACLAFLGMSVYVLGQIEEITQLMCNNLSVQEPLVL